MDKNNINLAGLQAKINAQGERTPKIEKGNIFADRRNVYLNEFQLYISHFNAIPNFIHEIKIDCKKANQWFVDKYHADIRDMHFDKIYYNNSKSANMDDIFYILDEDLLIDFDINNSTVRFLFRKTPILKVEEVIAGIKNFKKRKEKRKPEIKLLITTRMGIDTQSITISKPKLNITDNYNDDFNEIHKIILSRLSKKNDKGLVLLHGKPGTGKTSYIRYLISVLKKDVIFLPPNMAGAITNPDLINVLVNNQDCIFVIEDAENIVVDREKDGNSPVSALLNLSDGLLSDCLNIQIICSFNTDISKVDSALMRKGRMIAKYEFKELNLEKAQQLSGKLYPGSKILQPMTLAEIYNQHELSFTQNKQRAAIGFMANNN